MRHRVLIVATALLALSVVSIDAQRLDPGLVTAMDRLGGNLLGTDSFDAVLIAPPEPIEPERLRIYLSETQTTPVEIIVVGSPDSTLDPPDPVRAFFKITVGGPGELKLEYDGRTGEIIPCVIPGIDLSGIAAPPLDSSRVDGRLRPGLVAALGEVGAHLLGPDAFDAVLITPPDPVAPQRLQLFVSRTARIEFVLSAPPDPVTPFANIVVGGDEVLIHFDVAAAGARVVPSIELADLSGIVPPSR